MKKKANNKLPYMKRGVPELFLSAKANTYATRMKKLFRKSMMFLFMEEDLDNEEGEFMLMVAILAHRRYIKTVQKGDIHISASPSLKKTIDDFELQHYWSFFRFTKDDLKTLKDALLFDEEYILPGRYRMSGEEVFLRGLYELVSGETQFKIAELVFGGDQPLQSRAFTVFIDHIYNNFLDLVTNNLNWWYDKGWIDKSRCLISKEPQRLFSNIYRIFKNFSS